MDMATINPFPTENVTRISLQADEVLTLHLGGQTAQVVSGVAWITQDKKDMLLTTGSTTTFRNSPYPIAISAMRHQPVTLDIITS